MDHTREGDLHCLPYAELEPTAALELAKQQGLEHVIIMGYRPNGSMWVAGSGTLADANMTVDLGKREILRIMSR